MTTNTNIIDRSIMTVDGWEDPATGISHLSLWPEPATECGIHTDGTLTGGGFVACAGCIDS